MKRIIFLNFLLVCAGIAHLMDPYSFSNFLPLFIPYKYFIIISTGILNITLALLLWFKRTRYFAASALTAYFILLTYVHLYTSINHIPMMGIENPLILWVRTFLQIPLIYLTLSLRKV